MSEMKVEKTEIIELFKEMQKKEYFTDEVRKGLGMAIKVLEENEINKMNKGLCKQYYNQMMETDKIAQAKISELKEENEKLQQSRDDFAEASSRYYEELQELKSQLSAVEVLEWLARWYDDEERDIFEADSLDYLFKRDTPQEIVNKITEFEKSKKPTLTTEEVEKHIESYKKVIQSDILKKATSELVSNSDEFKVGDWVRNKNYPNVYYKVAKIDDDKLYDNKGNFDYVKCLKHAEPPKEEPHTCKNCRNNIEYPPAHTCDECTSLNNEEEYSMWTPKEEFNIGNLCWWNDRKMEIKDIKDDLAYCDNEHYKGWLPIGSLGHAEEQQVEWVYECYLIDDFKHTIKSCERSEESAIKVCEKLAKENGWKMFYRKVCRKKEQL